MKLGFCSLLCFLALGSVAVYAQASKTADPATQNEERTLRALLDEVRQLRIALQRAKLNTYRAQITVERLRIQQDKVDRVARDLREVRAEIEERPAWLERMSERVKDLEKMMPTETDSVRRMQLETELKDRKYGFEMETKRQEQRRERESQLSNQLQAEQLKLSELNDRLETLDREIEKQVTEEVPNAKPKNLI